MSHRHRHHHRNHSRHTIPIAGEAIVFVFAAFIATLRLLGAL